MEHFGLSKIQEQFWTLNRIYQGNTAYNIPTVFRIDGVPNTDILQRTVNILVSRHQMLRTVFFRMENEVFQKEVSNPENLIKVISVPDTLPDTGIPVQVINEAHRPFDLEKEDRLFRITQFVFNDNRSILEFVFHHTIIDLHSFEIFAEEFSTIFNALYDGETIDLVENNNQYSEYIQWQNDWLSSDAARKMTDYWNRELYESTEPLDLPTDFDRPRQLSLKGKRHNFKISREIYAKIKSFAKSNIVSPYIILLTAYYVTLHRLSKQKKIVIGIPMTNRKREESKGIFGCFMNVIPLKIDFEEGITGVELIKKVRNGMLGAHRNQESPLRVLIENSNSRIQGSGNPLFQVGFTLEPLINLDLRRFKVEPLLMKRDGAQLELFFIYFEKDGEYHVTFEYSTELYLESSIKKWQDIFLKTLISLMDHSSQGIETFDVLSIQDRERLGLWNDTNTAYEDDICVHTKFENQVKKYPNETALELKGDTLTYSQFNIHSNRLAHYLLENGVKIEDKIGICLDRSFELMIAIYGVLKAGAAYVPMDPSFPSERLVTISEDADLNYIVTTKSNSNNISHKGLCIYVDDILSQPISEKTSDPNVPVQANNLAYIIYTSGSTGKPKGVMIEHRSVLNKISWMQNQYPLKHREGMVLKTPITFDVAVWELFWWFFNGANLAILEPDGEKNPKTIVQQIISSNPAVLIFVPSLFSAFVDYLSAINQERCLNNIRWIVLIGETLQPALVNRYNNLFKNQTSPQLINTYGPSEATVAVTYYDCPKNQEVQEVFIGKPIGNTKLFVVNQKHKIQPIGIPGELIITGDNLARGYQKSPALTQEKFLEIELLDGTTTRAYKTGDLAKWDQRGELSFIGRIDNQVKIRGFRVELGEIESKILEFPGIDETAVVTSGGNSENVLLIAYVVLKKRIEKLSEELGNFLSAKLPSSMIPNQVIQIEEMPLTTSGKINRKDLPSPKFRSYNGVPPTSKHEKKLVEIWKRLLQINELGIEDNFFDLGGNSLLAINLLSEIQRELAIDLDVITVFEYPNIRAFAGYLSKFNRSRDKMAGVVETRATLRKRQHAKLERIR